MNRIMLICGTILSLASPMYRIANSEDMVQSRKVVAPKGISLDLVFIEPGTYIIGRDIGRGEKTFSLLGGSGKHLNEGPKRKVIFQHGFLLGRYQVTAQQYAVFLNDLDPAGAEKCVVLNRLSHLALVTSCS